MILSMKEKLIFAVALLLVGSCTIPENKSDLEKKVETSVTNELPFCDEIKQYPVRFSYASSSYQNKLFNKIQTPLTISQREALFMFDKEEEKYVPYEIYDINYDYFNDYDVFPVEQISYETATLIIYLVKRKEEQSENDQLVLVLYNKNNKPCDVLYTVLEDVYESTYEIEFSSPNKFKVINTDKEYSPDPESEAEDIASGRIIEPTISTQYYYVDTLRLKFNNPQI